MNKILKVDKLIKNYKIDICDFKKIENLISYQQPDYIFHLAAQALVHHSYIDQLPLGRLIL